jgi:hypothetical protein
VLFFNPAYSKGKRDLTFSLLAYPELRIIQTPGKERRRPRRRRCLTVSAKDKQLRQFGSGAVDSSCKRERERERERASGMTAE